MASIIVLMIVHGTIPFINAPALDVLSVLVGPVKCAADNLTIFPFICKNIGYPVGWQPVLGYSYYVLLGWFYKLTSIPLVDDAQILNSLLLAIAFVFSIYFLYRLTRSILASWIGAFTFFVSPFLVGLAGFGGTYYGFILFPVYIGISFWLFTSLWQADNKTSFVRFALAVVLQELILIFAVFMDGYSYVMAIISIWILSISYLLFNKTLFRKRQIVLMAGYTILLALPGLFYKLSTHDATPAFPLAFLRGEGIDLITMVIPTKGWLFANLMNIGPIKWNGYAFYGDGNNANFNYIGPFILLAALVSVVLVTRNAILSRKHVQQQSLATGTARSRKNWLKTGDFFYADVEQSQNEKISKTLGAKQINSIFYAVVLIGVIGLVISLGPSLKVYNTRPSLNQTQIDPGDYLMPPDKAFLTLPTTWFFRIPVVNTMRVVYRWQLMFRFSIAVTAAFLIGFLIRKKIAWGYALWLLLVLESLPSTLLTAQKTFRNNRAEYDLFNRQVGEVLRPYIKPGDRVLYLPSENDFLISLITPLTGGYTYNAFQDKSLEYILKFQPKQVPILKQAFNNGSLTANEVVDVLCREKDIDKIVFLYFSLRWNSYYWPPTSKVITGYVEAVNKLGLEGEPALLTHKTPLFTIVQCR